MISLQSAQGSWNLDCSFAEVLGFQLPDIQASSPLADNSVYIAEDLRELMTSDKCDNSSQLWATALALSWFHRKRCQFEAEWTLSVKKAEEWMHREPCPRGFLPEDLKTLSYQALLLLETETRRARSASVDATPRNKEDGCDWRWTVSLGSLLSNKDGNGDSDENVTYKKNFRCFKLYLVYSVSFNSSNVGKFFWSWILRLYRGSRKEIENRCPMSTSSTKREIRHFHVVVVQWRQRNVQKSVMYLQSCCFASLNLLLVDVTVVFAEVAYYLTCSNTL